MARAAGGAIAPHDDPAPHAFADRVPASLEPVVGHHLAVEDRVVIGDRRRSVFVLEDGPARIGEAMDRSVL